MPVTRSWWPIWAIVPVLVGVNWLNNRGVGRSAYVPVSVGAVVVLLLIAHVGAGRSWDDLGLAPSRMRTGLRWGAVLFGATLLILLSGLVLPATRGLFEDDRVRDLGGWGALWAAFVRVPFGTVLLEEVAFRAVLPAVLAVKMRRWKAIGLAAVGFGLWHILPSMSLHRVNPVADDTVGQMPLWITVAGSVLSTAGIGIWFSFLRERTGSLLTPMIAHWSSNALGYLFAWAVLNR